MNCSNSIDIKDHVIHPFNKYCIICGKSLVEIDKMKKDFTNQKINERINKID